MGSGNRSECSFPVSILPPCDQQVNGVGVAVSAGVFVVIGVHVAEGYGVAVTVSVFVDAGV